jgi:multidrug/hemolysin transport system permease protein
MFALTRRSLRLFLRDLAAVWLSFLSPAILILLYVLFLGQLQLETLTENLPNANPEQIEAFLASWVFAGVTMISIVTTGLAALCVFVDDRATGRFRDFLVSPVARNELILSYLFASFIVAVSMSTLILTISQVYMILKGYPLMALNELATSFGYVLLSAAAFSAIFSLIVTFIPTMAAFSGVSTVVGALSGFLAGAYIPPGVLPATVVNVLNVLPLAQAATLIRQPFTATTLEILADDHQRAVDTLTAFYGITIEIGDFTLQPAASIAVLATVTIGFAMLGAHRVRGRIR